MKPHRASTLVRCTLLCGAALAPAAYAGGLQLYELGLPDVGLAAAGWAARAQDPGTVFRNPAGLSLLSGTQVQGGLQLTYGSVEFSVDHGATSPSLRNDGDGGNAVGALPAGGLFASHSLSDKFAVGFGAFSYFGLAEDYGDNWAGRYYLQDGAMLGMSLMPAASFKATDWLSVGAGLNAMYGYLKNDVAIRTGPLSPDGQLSLRDETWGFGANAGIMAEPCQGTRLGVTYLSPVKLDFEDRPSFNNLGPLGGAIFSNPSLLDLGVTVPQSVMFSVYQELTPKWTLLANVGWQDWSRFGKVEVGVDSANPASLTTSLDYQDTWHAALGAQFHASEKWLLSAGFAYDSSAVDDANRTFAVPMGEAFRFGLGAQWQIGKATSLGAAYEFLWAGDMPVTQDSVWRGRVSGSFDNAWFSFFNLNLGLSF